MRDRLGDWPGTEGDMVVVCGKSREELEAKEGKGGRYEKGTKGRGGQLSSDVL